MFQRLQEFSTSCCQSISKARSRGRTMSATDRLCVWAGRLVKSGFDSLEGVSKLVVWPKSTYNQIHAGSVSQQNSSQDVKLTIQLQLSKLRMHGRPLPHTRCLVTRVLLEGRPVFTDVFRSAALINATQCLSTKANRIGHILRRNCLPKRVTEGKIEGTGRRGRSKQLLNYSTGTGY